MSPLFLETILNGVQLGLALFLISAGLTLVLGIMNLVNLAHGSLFMVGAYIGAYCHQQTGSFVLAILAATVGAALVGLLMEYLVLQALYAKDHLDQVVATFGAILFFNQAVLRVFGARNQDLSLPAAIDFPLNILGFRYPAYRLLIIAAGLGVAAALYWLIAKTRLGMLIRAGASNREMLDALGIDVKVLFAGVFALGAALAGIAGILIAPIEAVESGMGEPKLLLAFVVIVIGGIGSIRGAFVASLLIALVEVFGRVFMTDVARLVISPAMAQLVGPALASMSIYILMAALLYFRPQGLFAARTG
jgi:branched-chain amino acid transport system permease protein